MTEPNPDRPRTVDIDGEISRRVEKDGLLILGLVTAFGGLVVRVFARTLATSPRERGGDVFVTDTYCEKLYADLGIVSLAFGLALIVVSMARAPRHRNNA